jgi:hypothetical protein
VRAEQKAGRYAGADVHWNSLARPLHCGENNPDRAKSLDRERPARGILSHCNSAFLPSRNAHWVYYVLVVGYGRIGYDLAGVSGGRSRWRINQYTGAGYHRILSSRSGARRTTSAFDPGGVCAKVRLPALDDTQFRSR